MHSSKDMPAVLPEGLTIGAVLPREDPLDAIVLPQTVRLKPDTTDHGYDGSPVGSTGVSGFSRTSLPRWVNRRRSEPAACDGSRS